MSNDPGDDVAERLRRALDDAAADISPSDRFSVIQDGVSHQPQRRFSRWLPPVAAAAAVALIAVVVWAFVHPATGQPTPAGTVAVGTPSPTAATGSGPLTTTTGSGSPATSAAALKSVAVALPVYRVVVLSGATARYSLAREFVSVALPADATTADKANAALSQAMTARTAVDGASPFLAAWPSSTTATYQELADPELSISLSGPGNPTLDPGARQLAVQALVWTVTAVTQRADAPVRVGVTTGGEIFDGLPANVFKRPSSDRAWTELSTVWVDSPSAGQTFRSGSTVVVSGQACTFEANVVWELRQGTTVVTKGAVTAASACPTQGAWSVDLGALSDGQYQLWAMDVGAKQGETTLAVAVPFSVG